MLRRRRRRRYIHGYGALNAIVQESDVIHYD